MTLGKGPRQDELKGPESTSKPTLPMAMAPQSSRNCVSCPHSPCDSPLLFSPIPLPSSPPLISSPLFSPVLPHPDQDGQRLGCSGEGMGGGREKETQCREVGGSQLLFTVYPRRA